MADDIAKTLLSKPKLLERKTIIPRVLDKIMEHVEKFYEQWYLLIMGYLITAAYIGFGIYFHYMLMDWVVAGVFQWRYG